MMEYVKLKDITLSTQYGYTADETSKTEGVYKYLRITDIVPYFVNFETVPFCSIPQNKVEQYLVREGDVLIARTGATTGYNYVVSKGVNNTVYASYLIRFNLDKSKILPSYLKYVLKSKTYYGFVNNYIGGSAQPGMNARIFGRFNVPYNTLSAQRRIASILSAYDNLIENNNRRIRLLEQMAENLYKEWFVRFRFPGHEKAEFENGLPKSWKVEKVKSIVKRLPFNRTYKEYELEKQGAVIVIDQSTDDSLGYHNNEPSHYANYDNPLLLFGDHSCKFQLMTRNFSLGENVIPFTTNSKSRINEYWLFYATHKLIQTEEYKRHWGRFVSIKVLVPDIKIQLRFENIVKTFEREKNQLLKQNTLLSRQRDLLLPRLMSGKLEVKA
ncbi:MAG: restriction endonuclease subunit S [Prevotella sp.]|nr:restriction endonuclease subunit S [Prevotella sp.]